jgi:hypothetical protein
MLSVPALRTALCSLVVVLGPGAARAQFVNASFESGDLTGWEVQDLEDPYTPLGVEDTGVELGFGTFAPAPTDGTLFAVTGFEGDGPGTIFLAQDVTVPAARSTLMFDYQAGWDLAGLEAGEDRTFSVVIEPTSGGEPLQTTVIRTAVAGDVVDDTGLTTASVDLSAFAGQAVRVKFAWFVSEDESGPAAFLLDNVRFAGKKPAPADVASLKVKLNFVFDSADSLNLSLLVPVSEEFTPEDQDVSITVGDASFDFTLDAQGKASDEGQTLTVKPAGSGLRKLTLHCVQSDLLFDVSDYGLDNVDTGPAGIFCAVPVSVDLDGTLSNRTLAVLYKATEDQKGAATGKVAGDDRAGKLVAKLNFATADSDSLTLKGVGKVQPGFAPEGVTASVSVGSLVRDVTLDADGKAESEDGTVAIKRDAKDPSLYAVTLSITHGDLAETLADDGFTDVAAPKPGVDVPVEMLITLDGRVVQTFVTAKWVATEGVSGVAKGKF